MLGPPLFLLVTHARLHSVNHEQLMAASGLLMAASGLYDGPLFTPAVTVVWQPSCTLQMWPEQHVLIDVTAPVRELFLAKRRQLNVITCLNTPTVNTSCFVYTLAGSQHLTQDVRETTNYVARCMNEPTVTNDFWRNAFLYNYDYMTHVCESVGTWPRWCSTWQVVPRQLSNYHRPPPDFHLPARGKRVQRQLPDYCLPFVFRLSSAILRLPPCITDQLQFSCMSCFCLLLLFYVLVPFPRQ